MSEDRLARIEAKLDKLSDAVVAIARTEEQIATIFTMHKAMEAKIDNQGNEITKLRERTHDITNKLIIVSAHCEKVDRIEERLDDVRMDAHDNTKMTKRITWVAGVLFASTVALVANLIKI